MSHESFSHLDERGHAHMVDVSEKSVTRRSAVASACVRMTRATADQVRQSQIKKGDVLQVARLAGIGAAKRTDELIPLCHCMPLDYVQVDFDWIAEDCLEIRATAAATARTGVEMEALVAASVASLTVYDMCKSLDKGIVIEQVQLLEKTGGKSGTWQRGTETR